MRTLYLDCSRGTSGDMLISSTLCHLNNISLFTERMKGIALDEVELIISDTIRNGIKGKSFKVEAAGSQPFRHLSDIVEIINGSALSETVKTSGIQAFETLAEAEASVHGTSPEKVHFHEIGAIDTIYDIVGFYVLLELLNVENVVNSPINVGKGTFSCAHGSFSAPGPAVSELLVGRRIMTLGEEGERTTPTGAVLLSCSSKDGDMPQGKLISNGYGFGKREYADGNYLRSMLVDDDSGEGDVVTLMECSIDDMTPEHLGYATEVLLEAGALDVWQQPIYMKKNRLGTKLSVLCRNEDKFTALIFKHTTTLGIRTQQIKRHLRGKSTFTEKDGVRIKHTGKVSKAEFEDLRQLARKLDKSIIEIADGLK